MKCPFCKEKETSVLDSRPTEDGGVIRRRRICGCERKERFTTFAGIKKWWDQHPEWQLDYKDTNDCGFLILKKI